MVKNIEITSEILEQIGNEEYVTWAEGDVDVQYVTFPGGEGEEESMIVAAIGPGGVEMVVACQGDELMWIRDDMIRRGVPRWYAEWATILGEGSEDYEMREYILNQQFATGEYEHYDENPEHKKMMEHWFGC